MTAVRCAAVADRAATDRPNLAGCLAFFGLALVLIGVAVGTRLLFEALF